jgi:hypothetical protein
LSKSKKNKNIFNLDQKDLMKFVNFCCLSLFVIALVCPKIVGQVSDYKYQTSDVEFSAFSPDSLTDDEKKEAYVLGNDLEKNSILKSLIPGTSLYYYLTLLHKMNTDSFSEEDEVLLNHYVEQFPHESEAKKLWNKYQFVKYDRSTDETGKKQQLEVIREKILGINFNHGTPPEVASTSQDFQVTEEEPLQSVLDQSTQLNPHLLLQNLCTINKKGPCHNISNFPIVSLLTNVCLMMLGGTSSS